ncbi:MAG: hypothetical protein ABSA52_14130 [Candidatus Binatia bacterium]
MRSVTVWGNDYHGVSSHLIANGQDIMRALQGFHECHGNSLPSEAALRLRAFVEGPAKCSGSFCGIPGTQWIVTILASFRSEFEYLIADRDEVVRSLVDRAFIHLQRSIVADVNVAASWRRAFEEGETRCEKLGAAHLLVHGIWGFKASAKGEQTDLVLGTPLELSLQLRRAAEGLVLTEWKVVRVPTELDAKALQAYEQARRYSGGVLGGFVLSSRRYLVMVSSDVLTMPNPRDEGMITYEFINVAVSPSVPSAG